MSRSPFPSVRITGGLLTIELLEGLTDGKDLPGLDASSYHLAAGESVRQAASRAWEYLVGVWSAFHAELSRRAGPTTGLTRERWLLILLRELQFGRVPVTPAGGLMAGEKAFPVSHLWEHVPVHLLGWGVDLDRRTPGMAGAAGAAPQAMVQELLNGSDDHLWAVLSNGQRLRLLRDSTSLVGSAAIEFDLEAMFDGALFSDFLLLYQLCHQSRFEPLEAGAGPAACWLECWRTVAAEQGMRALDQLRGGVQDAIAALGTGLLQHPSNAVLRQRLASGALRLEDFQRALLRCVYRLLFWFVAEDRDALHPRGADELAIRRYAAYFSSDRLRELARLRRGDRYADLWQAVGLVFGALGREGGRPELGLPGIGGLFNHGPLDTPIAGGDEGGGYPAAELANQALLSALRSLSIVRDKAGGPRRRVDFLHLGAEELGSVYESLLELHPRHDPALNTFWLEAVAGSERKTTGSYYTPSSLVECLLDTALDPLLDEACRADDPLGALLSLTVCDPACGSGHFLVAAARRIAKRVAAIETDEPEPTPEAVRSALPRVVSRCIYGVDINPMAAELAKVSLWLEALDPGQPLSFLDGNIRVGNALLGVTPALLASGIPDEAFVALEGDDKKLTASLRKRNRSERSGEGDLFTSAGVPVENLSFARSVAQVVSAPVASLADVHAQATRLRGIEDSPERRRAKLRADAWCTAFVQPKTFSTAITQAVLHQIPDGVNEPVLHLVEQTERAYRFFHWHLEFPQIFTVTEDSPDWSGGFTCVLGNPPWERVKLQEQEFFAARDPDIAAAPNAAARRRLIKALEQDDPNLHAAFVAAKRRAEGESHMLRASGRYPLTGRGDINTYAVFAETDRTILDTRGRIGVILPTGIATDATTQYFFRDIVESSSLASLYDFENAQPIFEGVHRSFKFCLLTLTGRAALEKSADFAFFLRNPADLSKEDGRFTLEPSEITLLNPNTGTCPIFRSRHDAEITLDIYRRVPVLENHGEPGDSWMVEFQRMLDLTNDSALFIRSEEWESNGWTKDGSRFVREHAIALPLYEGKMSTLWDHRAADIVENLAVAKRQRQPRYITDDEHDDPRRHATPLYWVEDRHLPGNAFDWQVGFSNITSPTNERTLVVGPLPPAAVANSLPLIVSPSAHTKACLLANLSSFVLDFVARQKIGGVTMNFFIVEQLPVLSPRDLARPLPWHPSASVLEWLSPRVLELGYTSWDMTPLANALDSDGAPFRWDEWRRSRIRAEIDAAFFHLYGIERDDVGYIVETFPIVRRKDVQRYGEYQTKRLILEVYDAMTEAIETGEPYRALLDPPPGQGPRHPSR